MKTGGRAVSPLIGAVLLVAVVTVVSILVYHIVTGNVVNAVPHKAAVEMHAAARLDKASLGRVYVDVYISCAGPYCSKYTLQQLEFTLYFDYQGVSPTNEIYQLPEPIHLRNGVTKVSYVIYYEPATATPRELIVDARVFPPNYRGLGWDFIDLLDSISFHD